MPLTERLYYIIAISSQQRLRDLRRGTLRFSSVHYTYLAPAFRHSGPLVSIKSCGLCSLSRSNHQSPPTTSAVGYATATRRGSSATPHKSIPPAKKQVSAATQREALARQATRRDWACLDFLVLLYQDKRTIQRRQSVGGSPAIRSVPE